MPKVFKWIDKLRTHCPELGPIISFKNLIAGLNETEWKVIPVFWVFGNIFIWVSFITAAISFIAALAVVGITLAILGAICLCSVAIWQGSLVALRYVLRPSKIPVNIYRLCLRGRLRRLRAKGVKKEVIGAFRREEKLRELVPPAISKVIKKI